MTEYEEAISKLSHVKQSTNGWFTARCPAHDDKHNSLLIKDDRGKAAIQCMAGCAYKDIMQRLELSEREKPPDVMVATYDYTDAECNLLYQVVRYEPKGFRQRTLVDGEWVWKRDKSLSVLYHLPEVIAADEVFIVEGEKDADNLRMNGFVATSIAGGANAQWMPEHTLPLKDKRIILIPDNDMPGKTFMELIARNLYGWSASIKKLALKQKDISDFLMEESVDKLKTIINNTPFYQPIGAVTRDEFNHQKGMFSYLWRKYQESLSYNTDRYIYK